LDGRKDVMFAIRINSNIFAFGFLGHREIVLVSDTHHLCRVVLVQSNHQSRHAAKLFADPFEEEEIMSSE
jgi:hypothetical protein